MAENNSQYGWMEEEGLGGQGDETRRAAAAEFLDSVNSGLEALMVEVRNQHNGEQPSLKELLPPGLLQDGRAAA